MGISGFTEEFTSTVAADKLFKANVVDGHKLIPKLMPQIVASASIIEGDGGVGSIRQLNFTDAIPFNHIKERFDVLDMDKLECKLTVIEGADIGKKLEWATCHIKVDAAPNGGSIYKVSCEYKSLTGIDYSEDEVNIAKSGFTANFKAIEAYILANPDY